MSCHGSRITHSLLSFHRYPLQDSGRIPPHGAGHFIDFCHLGKPSGGHVRESQKLHMVYAVYMRRKIGHPAWKNMKYLAQNFIPVWNHKLKPCLVQASSYEIQFVPNDSNETSRPFVSVRVSRCKIL